MRFFDIGLFFGPSLWESVGYAGLEHLLRIAALAVVVFSLRWLPWARACSARPIPAAQVRTERWLVPLNLVAFPVLVFPVGWILYRWGYADLKTAADIRSVVGFLAMLACHDAYFYACHRLMHRSGFLARAHAIHHRSVVARLAASYNFHLVEAAVEVAFLGFASVFSAVFFGTIDAFAFSAFIWVYVFANLFLHGGYEIFPEKLRASPWFFLNTPTLHASHHARWMGDYGLYTRIWDRIFRTEGAVR